jgi:hypothetical protein
VRRRVENVEILLIIPKVSLNISRLFSHETKHLERVVGFSPKRYFNVSTGGGKDGRVNKWALESHVINFIHRLSLISLIPKWINHPNCLIYVPPLPYYISPLGSLQKVHWENPRNNNQLPINCWKMNFHHKFYEQIFYKLVSFLIHWGLEMLWYGV